MNFEVFQKMLVAKDQIRVNRTTDACTWYFRDLQLFHERAVFPWNVFQKSYVRYWGETVFTDLELAKIEAAKYNEAVVQECFYCDANNPSWFIIFHEFDHAAEHSFNQLLKDGKLPNSIDNFEISQLESLDKIEIKKDNFTLRPSGFYKLRFDA